MRRIAILLAISLLASLPAPVFTAEAGPLRFETHTARQVQAASPVAMVTPPIAIEPMGDRHRDGTPLLSTCLGSAAGVPMVCGDAAPGAL